MATPQVLDVIVILKSFSARVTESENLPLPVRVELLDLGMNPFYEMEITSRNGDGNYTFSKERPVVATLAKPAPYSVRFTAPGKDQFIKDFPV